MTNLQFTATTVLCDHNLTTQYTFDLVTILRLLIDMLIQNLDLSPVQMDWMVHGGRRTPYF